MSNQTPQNPAPKLYNWVRAIKKISVISAFYSTIVIATCLLISLLFKTSEASDKPAYDLLCALVSTLLLTIGLRGLLLRKLLKNFKSNFSYELLLAYWCILLILIHLQCQLLSIILYHASILPIVTYSLFIFIILVLIGTWPRLKTIQSLLSGSQQ